MPLENENKKTLSSNFSSWPKYGLLFVECPLKMLHKIIVFNFPIIALPHHKIIGSIQFRPPHHSRVFYDPPVTNYMLLYSMLLCKKIARSPGGHKRFMLTKLGEGETE